MRTFDLIAILIVMAAVFSYINLWVLKLPDAIGLTALTLLFSMAVFLAGLLLPGVEVLVNVLIAQFDFNEALLHGMLGFLHFAGALHIVLGDLARNRWPIAILATLGVLLSTLIVGGVQRTDIVIRVAHLFAFPVVWLLDSTGFDSGEPCCLKKMESTT